MVVLTPADLQKRSSGSEPEFDLPLVRPLPPEARLSDIFLRLCSQSNCVWLDSAKQMQGHLGRYSFLTANPQEMVTLDSTEPQPLERLERFQPFLDQPAIPGLPPFQGGIAGVFGYELGRCYEQTGQPQFNDLPTPILSVGFYDWTIAFDHHLNQGWVICQGWSETEPSRRRRAALERYEEVKWWLDSTPAAIPCCPKSRRSAAQLAPQYGTPLGADLTSNFAPGAFRDSVGDIVKYIREGDVFQVNLAQRLLMPDQHGPAALYLRMRSRNPAPFAGYFDGGDWQIISSSPERFLRVANRSVETRPIKGTCPRTGDEAEDRRLGEQLRQSAKDRAENVMIVDLMRNDLSRCCTDESIDVSQLCGLEQYECVQHLVSVVQGRLKNEATTIELLKACFPGGSITGAPKVRAMQIISEMEPTARGPYCGSLGYLSTGGSVDLNILIRTVTATDGWLQLPVGGGITSRSDPMNEEQETWHKAEGMLRAVL